jgi:BlaI family transcriptional regulator, penicillinase repressor
MPRSEPPGLSRRERQIMDILYRGRRATAAEIHQAMSDAPSYSAVRATLRILEEKGYVRHREEGPRYLYLPTLARQKATLSAVKHLVETFFEGSAEKAVATLLDSSSSTLSEDELDRIADLIERARKGEK